MENYGWCRLLSILLSLVMIINTINVAFVQGGATQKGGMGNHFVLVHGASHGAWCWYKVITLLKSQGNHVTAIDLTSNGINKVVADEVTSLAQYVKPLIDFLESNITHDEKVILVGHSFGGVPISYAMEHLPSKIEKAIFLSAYMPSNGESLLPMEDSQDSQGLIEAGVFILNNGNTSLSLNLSNAAEYFYNRSPIEDINLAFLLLNPTPFAPVAVQNLTLTQTRYGRIKRYYIKTTMDRALVPSLQAQIVQNNPPNQVFTIQGSDHASFFSYPEALSMILVSIARKQTSKK